MGCCDRRRRLGTRFQRLSKAAEKLSICAHCFARQPKYTLAVHDSNFYMGHRDTKGDKILLRCEELYKILDNVTDADARLLGLDPDRVHPRDHVLTVLPVLPPVDRPCVNAEGVMCDDDLTIQITEIMKTNRALMPDSQTAPGKRPKHEASLRFRIKCFIDNSQNRAKHTNGRPFKGLKERMSGKKRTGPGEPHG